MADHESHAFQAALDAAALDIFGVPSAGVEAEEMVQHMRDVLRAGIPAYLAAAHGADRAESRAKALREAARIVEDMLLSPMEALIDPEREQAIEDVKEAILARIGEAS